MEKEFTTGQMEIDMRENGKKAKKMGKEFTISMMEINMRENIKKTREMGKEFTIGQTKIGRKDSTIIINLMERPSSTVLMGEWKKEFMKRER